MLIAIISDTHLPRAQRRLPDACIQHLRAADLIIHAGDFVRSDVIGELQTYGPVIGVHGNMDEPALRNELPRELELEVAPRITVGLVHDAGPASGRLERMRRRFPDAAAVVFGHSHIPLHEQDGGFQLFNPGSPTDRRRQPHHTMGFARVDSRPRISFELIELD